MHSDKKFVLVTTLSSLIFGIATTAIASNSPATLAQTPRQKKPQAQVTVVEANNLRFQIQGCQRTDLNVTCSLLITNLAEKDRGVLLAAKTLEGASRSFDFSGNEYVAQAAQLGRNQGDFANTVLLKGIPIKASISFEIPRQVSQLAAIEMSYSPIEKGEYFLGNYSKLVFRDVPITRSK